jgi:hypothetical protein
MKEHNMHDDIDEDLEAWDQFVTSVRCLSRGARPGLTLAEATREALTGWVSEQAALTNEDRPFAWRSESL